MKKNSPGLEKIQEACRQRGGALWEDPDFKAENRSLYYTVPFPLQQPVVWRRPTVRARKPAPNDMQ